MLFPGRKFNELMSRRMVRRLVVRSGTVVRPRLPDYSELDYDPAKYSYRLPPRPEQLEGILEVAEAVGVRPWDVTLGGRFREGVPELSSHCSRCLMEECACHSCYLVRRRSSFLSPRDALDAPWSEEPPAECQCPDCGATLPVRAGVRFADGRGARQKDECEERASVGAQGEEAGSLHGWVTWEPTEKYSASEDRAGRSRRSSLTRGSDMEEGARRLAQSPPLFVSSKRARDWGGVLGSVLTGCAVGALMGAAVTHVWHRASR